MSMRCPLVLSDRLRRNLSRVRAFRQAMRPAMANLAGGERRRDCAGRLTGTTTATRAFEEGDRTGRTGRLYLVDVVYLVDDDVEIAEADASPAATSSNSASTN